MYEEDNIKNRREYGMKLNQHFDTYVASWSDKKADPGDFDLKTLKSIILSAKTAIDYYGALEFKWFFLT